MLPLPPGLLYPWVGTVVCLFGGLGGGERRAYEPRLRPAGSLLCVFGSGNDFVSHSFFLGERRRAAASAGGLLMALTAVHL